MRRVATVLGSLATAGALTLGLAGSAWGATGTLTLNNVEYVNPSGCYTPETFPLIIDNRTDRLVTVYESQNCFGEPIGSVRPGSSNVFEFGVSVKVR